MEKRTGILITNGTKDCIVAASLVVSAIRNKNINYTDNIFVTDNHECNDVVKSCLEKIMNKQISVPETIVMVGLNLNSDTIKLINEFRTNHTCLIISFNNSITDDMCEWFIVKNHRSITKAVYSYYSDISWSVDYNNKYNPVATIVETSDDDVRNAMCIEPGYSITRLVNLYKTKKINFEWPY